MVSKAAHKNISKRGQAPDQLMLLEYHACDAPVFTPLLRATQDAEIRRSKLPLAERHKAIQTAQKC